MVRVLLLSLLFFSSSVLAEQDPTAPLGWLVPKEQKAAPVKKAPTRYRLPSLQSIVCKGGSPCYAILNGQVVSQGEVVRGYKVKKNRFRIRHSSEKYSAVEVRAVLFGY